MRWAWGAQLRLGGEELAVLALVQGQDELDSVAERLRDSFCRHAFELEDGPLEVTISLGTALATAHRHAVSLS